MLHISLYLCTIRRLRDGRHYFMCQPAARLRGLSLLFVPVLVFVHVSFCQSTVLAVSCQPRTHPSSRLRLRPFSLFLACVPSHCHPLYNTSCIMHTFTHAFRRSTPHSSRRRVHLSERSSIDERDVAVALTVHARSLRITQAHLLTYLLTSTRLHLLTYI